MAPGPVCALLVFLLVSASRMQSWQLPFFQHSKSGPLSFSLRHVYHHGAGEYPGTHQKLDLEPSMIAAFYPDLPLTLELKAQPYRTKRLRDRSRDAINAYRETLFNRPGEARWVSETVMGPDVEDIGTVRTLAKMTANAYVEEPGSAGWDDLDPAWNATPPWGFGWEDAGLRGHVFATEDNSTVVISMKGTSMFSLLGKGTGGKDRFNDNLLFSCCCARVSWTWSTVCSCYTGTYSCNQTCLETELMDKAHYYSAALDIYYNVTSLYPGAQVWMTGHSLGGSVAALTGMTFGLPTVAFQAPGDALAASRLHLPRASGSADTGLIWHFGNTADPIFMGVCNGPTSLCWAASFAMETHCHNGLVCEWDTVSDLGWHMSVQNHRIQVVIDDVITKYDSLPSCHSDQDCVDCYLWDFHS